MKAESNRFVKVYDMGERGACLATNDYHHLRLRSWRTPVDVKVYSVYSYLRHIVVYCNMLSAIYCMSRIFRYVLNDCHNGHEHTRKSYGGIVSASQ